MRNPNGYGGVTKLSGNRRKPYMAYFTSIESEGTVVREDVKSLLEADLEALKGTSDKDEMWRLAREILETTGEDIVSVCEESIKRSIYKGKQKKHPLGYFATKKEANICLAEYNKGNISTGNMELTFGEIYERIYEQNGMSEKSRGTRLTWEQGYARCEKLHKRQLRKITLADLEKILEESAELSTSTQRNVIKVLKAVFGYGMQHDIIVKDYSGFLSIEHKDAQIERKIFTKEEIERLWEVSDLDKLIMIYTGLRVGEYLALKKEDIHIDERIIEVHGTKTKNAERLVPIHTDILEILKEWEKPSVRYTQFQRSFKAMGHSSHDCRHTFVTYTFEMNEVLRKYIIGHAGGITQDIYTHPDMLKKELVKAIDGVVFR